MTAFYVQAAECAVFFCALNPPGSNGELSGGSYVYAAMNVIFLDIDGVLNCEDTPNPRKFPYIVDARLLSLLKGLLARTGANVVLSSSWRTDPVGLLAAKYYDVPFIDVCPDLPEVSRCEEMLRWLSEHQAVHRYVVIDDESDCLDDLPLFQPSSKTGLTIEIVEGVEKYLSGKTDDTMRQPAIVRLGRISTRSSSGTKVSTRPVVRWLIPTLWGESFAPWRASLWPDQFWPPSPLSITAAEGFPPHTYMSPSGQGSAKGGI